MMDRAQRQALLEEARSRLRAGADPARAEAARAFFPSNPPILGAPSGLSNALGKEMAARLKAAGAAKEDALAVAEALYGGGIMEEGAVANEMLSHFWRLLGPDDWDLFEHWTGLFNNWGTTDSFCLKVLGPLIRRDGPPAERLRVWTHAGWVWRRRAVLVGLIPSVRRGQHRDLAFELGDILLADPEDMIQKALGWMLKEAGKGDVEAVIAYLRSRRERMTRLALRYAMETMTAAEKAQVKGE